MTRSTPAQDVAPLDAESRVVVVGGGLAGARTISGLRRLGFRGAVTLVTAERHTPYDRPPLSKGFLAGDVLADEIALWEPAAVAGLEVEIVLGERAAALDLERRELTLTGGRTLTFDRVVVATGADPVLPDSLYGLTGVTGFRTLDDAMTLRDRVLSGAKVTVVGGGFIGAEIASTVRRMGHDITVVEAGAYPMQRVIGSDIGAELAQRHRAAGVDLRTGVGVQAAEGMDRVEALELEDGSRVDTDHVVVCIGVRPDLAWLDGNGLELGDGVRCDASGRASGGLGVVWAVGDAASWYHPHYGAHLRIEHWTSAVDGASIVASALVHATGTPPAATLPYFWSDQLGTKIQLFGRVSDGDRVQIVRSDDSSGRLLALYRCGDSVSAVLGFGMPREVMSARKVVSNHVPWHDALRLVTADGS